jgi:hypothetical protein
MRLKGLGRREAALFDKKNDKEQVLREEGLAGKLLLLYRDTR